MITPDAATAPDLENRPIFGPPWIGRWIGPGYAAGELIARALPVAFGPHLIQVVAPGFHPWAERFFADGSFPTRIRATLARQ